MIDADWLLEAAAKADYEDSCAEYQALRKWEDRPDRERQEEKDIWRPIVVAVLRELSKRPENWNRYELADMADEIEGVK